MAFVGLQPCPDWPHLDRPGTEPGCYGELHGRCDPEADPDDPAGRDLRNPDVPSTGQHKEWRSQPILRHLHRGRVPCPACRRVVYAGPGRADLRPELQCLHPPGADLLGDGLGHPGGLWERLQHWPERPAVRLLRFDYEERLCHGRVPAGWRHLCPVYHLWDAHGHVECNQHPHVHHHPDGHAVSRAVPYDHAYLFGYPQPDAYGYANDQPDL